MSQKNEHSQKNPTSDHALFGREESYILGYNVERYRLKADMSIAKFSRVAGIARPTIYKIERGESDLKLSYIKRIADALDISIVDLLVVPRDKPAELSVSAWFEAYQARKELMRIEDRCRKKRS